MSTPAAVRAWESHLTLYRTIWRSNVMAGFVQPLLYLVGMGLGVGALVDDGPGGPAALEGLSYFAFLAPGLLATTAMMTCANESLWPVMGGFRWNKTFHAQATTPLRPGDVVAGLMLWHATRGAIAATSVAAALVLFDETRSWGLVGAVAAGALVGVAFGAPLTAWSASRESDQSFPTILRFVIMPLFLFGGAFYPIDQLPGWMEAIARVTPLWHGVELSRDAVHGRSTWSSASVHVVVLVAYAAVGWWFARRTFTRRLGS